MAIQGLDPTRFTMHERPYSFWNKGAGGRVVLLFLMLITDAANADDDL